MISTTMKKWLVIYIAAAAMSLSARQKEINSIFWEYDIYNGCATIGDDYCNPAIDVSLAGNIVVPDFIDGCPVTRIGNSAFEGCSNITAVVLPSSVVEIGDSAFAECTKMSSINLPDELRIIEDAAFDGCENLRQVSFGNRLESIGWCAFATVNGGLEIVAIPASVKRIDEGAFKSRGLKSISVAAGNSYYKAVDGVLFTKSKNVLKCYPSAKSSTSYTIPSGTKSVEWGAFGACDNLTSVTIPASVDSLECNPFEGCRKLKALKVDSGNATYKSANGIVMSKDGSSVVIVPGGLSSITIPSSATRIDDNAFKGCFSLSSISIPNNIAAIGTQAFAACTNLKSVVISENVTQIADETFCACYSLEDVRLPSGLTAIGQEAFQDCRNLSNIDLPDCIVEIGPWAFEGCSSLKTVRFMGQPPDVLDFDEEVFVGVPDDAVGIYLPKCAASWAAVVDANGRWNGLRMIMDGTPSVVTHTITFNPNGGSVSPATRSVESGAEVGELPTPVNGDFRFLGWFTEAVGGESVSCSTLILSDTTFYAHWDSNSGASEWQYADDGNGGILITGHANPVGDFVIPSQMDGKEVTGIGDFVFRGCSDLTSVEIPDSVMNIGSQAFAYCSNLAYVTIGKGVSTLGELSWYFDTMGIDKYVFTGCSGLVSITVDSDNAYYSSKNGMLLSKDGKTLVQGVNGDVVVPDGVMNIGGFAFLGCSELTSVTIPNSVTNVMFGYGMVGWSYFSAFSGCGKLISISVDSDNAYYSSVNGMLLSKDGKVLVQGINGNVQIPDGVEIVGDCAFDGCDRLASVAIPNSVTSIGHGAFESCRSLTEVTIPNTVTSIWGSAFAFSGVTHIIIPDGVESVMNCTFERCGSLTNVVIGNGATSIGWDAFSGCDELRSLKIGSGVVDISEAAFDGCDGLMEIMVDDRNSAYLSVNRLLLTKDGKQLITGVGGDVVIPDSVTKINDRVFCCRSGVTSVIIGNGIATIDDCAFMDCISLTNVVIGGNVTNIGYGAFADCKNLLVAKVPWTLEKKISDKNVFGGCPESLVIEYYDPEAAICDLIVGMKTEVDVGLVGYAAKGFPSGLTYNAKTGKVSGAAKKPGESEVTFSKEGESATIRFVVREENVSVGCSRLSDGSFLVGVAGSAGGIPLEVATETGVKSVSVKNLPPGMKYDAKSGRIVGAPAKAGEFNVAVTVTTKSGAKRTENITISVAASSDDVVGIFNGFVVASDGVENAGTFQLTVSEAGKLAAKVTTAAGTYSFSDVCWDSEDDGIYSAMLETKKGDALSISIDTSAGWNTNQLSGVFAAYGQEALDVSARRNVFGKLWHFAATGDADMGWVLSYATNAKAADLSVALNADGSTRVAGKLGSLKVNASGHSDVTGLTDGVIFADFAPVVSVKDGRTSAKCVLSLRTNLWFDRSNNHVDGIGTIRLVR